jgi:heme exporter protein D
LIQSSCWFFFGSCLSLNYWQPAALLPHLSTLIVLAVVAVLILPIWQFFSALHFTIEYGRRWQLWIIAADISLLLASFLLQHRFPFWSSYGIQLLFLFSLIHTLGCWIDYLRTVANDPQRHAELLDVE